jgi:hypothetical protein
MSGPVATATAHAPSWTCEPAWLTAWFSALVTLRGKNPATKIENNSKIFDALSVVKEIDLKIDQNKSHGSAARTAWLPPSLPMQKARSLHLLRITRSPPIRQIQAYKSFGNG